MDTQQLAKKLAKEYMHPVVSNYTPYSQMADTREKTGA